jgi:hypothetical protein
LRRLLLEIPREIPPEEYPKMWAKIKEVIAEAEAEPGVFPAMPGELEELIGSPARAIPFRKPHPRLPKKELRNLFKHIFL